MSILLVAAVVAPARAEDEGPAPGLHWHPILNTGLGPAERAVPRDAVEVFTHEGKPQTVHVGDDLIAVGYGPSGVLFDRKTGNVSQRLTVADGWPEARPAMFGPPIPRTSWSMASPGVVVSSNLPDFTAGETEEQMRLPVAAASTHFDGREWRALQPRNFLWEFIETADYETSWTAILTRLNERSFVEAVPADGKPATRFTMRQGLASNIVTHLVVADGMLWAACVDIYDPAKRAWGPGGLCRFNPWTDRWERVDAIDGHPVRWVTLLEVVAGDLWVGFREGGDIAGDTVINGKGVFPEVYRPKTRAIVLARRVEGEGRWTTFSRPPEPDAPRPDEEDRNPPPTETPRRLARSGNHVILSSTMDGNARPSGNWAQDLPLHVSMLDLDTGQWRHVSEDQETGGRPIEEFLIDGGEVFFTSLRGVHRWVAARAGWQFLDPRSRLPHGGVRVLEPAGDEAWVATESGIDRYDERTGRWSHMGPAELRTGCPVRRIAAMPGGDVWVLFQPPNCLRPTAEPINRHPTGLGRYSGGNWEFPVRIAGVPETQPGADRPTRGHGPIEQLAAAGDRLLVGTTSGVYMGPGQWRRIAPEPVDLIEPAGKLQEVRFLRAGPHLQRGKPGVFRGRYDPATGQVSFEHVAAVGRQSREYLQMRASSPMNAARNDGWDDTWVEVPSRTRPGRWAIGPMKSSAARHIVIESRRAIWIASRDELVRLDRARLDAARD